MQRLFKQGGRVRVHGSIVQTLMNLGLVVEFACDDRVLAQQMALSTAGEFGCRRGAEMSLVRDLGLGIVL